MQKAHFRLTCEVLQKTTEGSLVRRVVIYKDRAVREEETERERLLYRRFQTLLTAYGYNIRLQKENCPQCTMKTKRLLHKISFVSTNSNEDFTFDHAITSARYKQVSG